MIRGWAFLAVPAMLGTCFGQEVVPAPGAATVESTVLPYRRILAPSDRKQDWPFRDERYLPISAADFNQAVERLPGTAAPPSDAILDEARLTATFDGVDRLSGSLELTFRPISGVPRLVGLTAVDFSIREATWRKSKQPALLGTTGDGNTAFWIEQADTLDARWSLRGRVDPAGGVNFDIVSFVAASCVLSLQLPANYVVQLDGSELAPDESPSKGPAKFSVRGLSQHRRLRVVPTKRTGDVARPTALRQDVDYEYSERGIDVTAQFRIDAVPEPLSRVEVELDPALTVVDARSGERRLSWTDVPTTKPALRRIALEFDPPLFGVGRTVMLRALAPALVGKRQSLPAVRCPDLDWRQGTMSLSVPSPLTISRIDPTMCAIAAPTPIAGERSGEVVEFTCFDSRATARVLVARAPDLVEATSVTAVTFGTDELTADYRAELRIAAGERFLIQAGVPTRWIVDSVSSVPAGAIVDWTLSEISDQRRWLTVRLNQSLRTDRPLRLQINARAPRPGAGAALRQDDLRIVEFRDARDDAPAAAVRSSGGWRLELEQERDEGALAAERLDPLRRELLGEFAPEFLLDLRTNAEPWRLRLSRRAARLEANVDVTAVVTQSGLVEHYRFRIKNLDDAPLDRLSVRFQPARSGPILWKTGDARLRFDARRLPAGESKLEEIWEVSLAEAAVEPFDFQAVRHTPAVENYEIALAAVVDADPQKGTVSIESDTTEVLIDPTMLSPAAVNESATRGTLVRGRFDYVPAQDVGPDVPTRLVVRRTPAAASADAVVWAAQIHTRNEQPGRLRNVIELQVQSLGAKSFAWRFPAEAKQRSIRVDDASVDVRSSVVEIPLSDREHALSTVIAEYDIETPYEAIVRTADLPSLDLNLPVLRVERTVDLPPDVVPVQGIDDDLSNGIATALRRWWTVASSSTSIAADRPASKLSVGVSERTLPISDASLRTMRIETVYGLRFLALAVGLVISYRFLFRRSKAFWCTTATLAACGASLPYFAAQIPIWMFLGILLGKVCETILPRSRRSAALSATSDRSHSGSSLRTATASLLAIATWYAVTSSAFGQSALSEPVPAVFVPVDERGHETGERYLVPERFWRTLTKQASRDDAKSGSLILSAEYTLQFTHDAPRKQTFVSQVGAKWNVKTFADDTEFSVPFDPFSDAAPAVLVDGRPVPSVLSPKGKRVVVVETAGLHDIEAVARTTSAAAGATARFELSIPRTLNDTVHCVAPAELAGLSLAEAVAAPTISDDRQTTTFRAMPGESLHFSWSNLPSVVERHQFEQYELWRIRPGSVTVDLKLRSVTKGAAGRELVFFADPRLQWLARRTGEERGVISASPVIVEQATIGQRLRWTLPEGVDSDDVLEASFLLSGATGIGRMRLPELRMEGEAASKRLIAFAIDPALVHTFGGSKGFVPLAIPEFERAWGGVSSLPQAALEYAGPTDDFSLALRPAPIGLTSTSTQTLICGIKRIEVVFDADLDASGDGVASHEVHVPAAIEIDGMSVVDPEGEEQLLRWSRDDAGSVVAFLRTQVRGRHRLQLRGRLQVPTPGKLPLPILAVAGTTGERRIRIARLPDAAATTAKLVQLTVSTTESLGETGGRGRIEQVLVVAGPKPSADLQIRGNAPLVDAQVMSTLRREATRWELELVSRLKVRSGVLDEIRLDLPPTIATPLTVSPAMPYEVSNLRDGRRRLVLHPRDAIRGDFQFAIRSPLTALDREHPVPHVRFRQVESADYFFQLPAQSGVNRVDWELEQLIAAESPADFARPTAEEVLTFRAVGPRPAAILRDVRRTVERPQVRLADYRVRLTEEGEHGVATFLVEPSGQTEYVLQLPDAVTPLAVRVGGADVAAAAGEQRITLTASTSRFPHLVEVLFRRTSTEFRECDFRTLAVPSLVDLPVARTLWTVETADDLGTWSLTQVSGATEQSVAQARANAYDGVTADLSSDAGLSVGAPWAVPLTQRKLRAQADLERWVTNAAGVDARRADLDSASSNRLSFEEIWSRGKMPAATTAYVVQTGPRYEVQMQPASTIAMAAALRLATPALFIVLAVAGYFWGRNDALLRWSPHLCALLGIAWLAFLQPPAIGWVLLVTAVACRLHPSLRSARDRRIVAPVALRLAR